MGNYAPVVVMGLENSLSMVSSLQVYTSLFIKSQVYNICKQQENNMVHTKHVQHLQYCGTDTFIRF